VLKERGYLAMGGQIIDATVVPAPKQRGHAGEEPRSRKDAYACRLVACQGRQKDRDARWSIKYTKAKVSEGADPRAPKPVDLAIPMFGYKNHIGIDKAHGLIRTWVASAANAHNGARLPDLVSKDNTASGVWADTAYRSKKNEAFLAKGMFVSNIHQKRLPRRVLPERIARANARRSKVRAHVEHVFAGQKHRMGLIVRTIGIARATIKIGMANLAYNFQRLAWLEGTDHARVMRHSAQAGDPNTQIIEKRKTIPSHRYGLRSHRHRQNPAVLRSVQFRRRIEQGTGFRRSTRPRDSQHHSLAIAASMPRPEI
jgi:hypothetical protein